MSRSRHPRKRIVPEEVARWHAACHYSNTRDRRRALRHEEQEQREENERSTSTQTLWTSAD